MTGEERHRLQVGVLISGRGSNLRALLHACADASFPADIVHVLSNRSDAKGLDHAREAGIATSVVNHKAYPDRQRFEQAMDQQLRLSGVNFLCLAGFMRLLSEPFVMGWQNRIINIHPSLLPSFKGLNTHERALEQGVKIHGCSVHFVRTNCDDGPLIAQAAVPVLDEDTPETLGRRVLEQEHQIYPLALRLVAEGRARLVGNRVFIGEQSHSGCLLNPPV